MLEIYHKCKPLITKTENDRNSSKRKTCISLGSRRKLVHELYISTKCLRTKGYILTKYSRKLDISQIIF